MVVACKDSFEQKYLFEIKKKDTINETIDVFSICIDNNKIKSFTQIHPSENENISNQSPTKQEYDLIKQSNVLENNPVIIEDTNKENKENFNINNSEIDPNNQQPPTDPLTTEINKGGKYRRKSRVQKTAKKAKKAKKSKKTARRRRK